MKVLLLHYNTKAAIIGIDKKIQKGNFHVFQSE